MPFTLPVQEQYHLASAFEILLAPGHGCNFLYDLTLVEYTRLRGTIIDLVLATDMKQHFALLSQAKTVSQHACSHSGYHSMPLCCHASKCDSVTTP